MCLVLGPGWPVCAGPCSSPLCSTQNITTRARRAQGRHIPAPQCVMGAPSSRRRWAPRMAPDRWDLTDLHAQVPGGWRAGPRSLISQTIQALRGPSPKFLAASPRDAEAPTFAPAEKALGTLFGGVSLLVTGPYGSRPVSERETETEEGRPELLWGAEVQASLHSCAPLTAPEQVLTLCQTRTQKAAPPPPPRLP